MMTMIITMKRMMELLQDQELILIPQHPQPLSLSKSLKDSNSSAQQLKDLIDKQDK